MIQNYRDLSVWQEAMDLVVACYETTERFPKTEIYGLANQLRRTAVSIPSNIAEGKGHRHLPEFIHFLHIVLGSLAELETQIQIARYLNYTVATQMLHGLLHSLKNHKATAPAT